MGRKKYEGGQIMSNQTIEEKINERIQGIAGLAQIALQDIYLAGYQDGINYAISQLSNSKEEGENDL
jgi:hypothetical protein